MKEREKRLLELVALEPWTGGTKLAKNRVLAQETAQQIHCLIQQEKEVLGAHAVLRDQLHRRERSADLQILVVASECPHRSPLQQLRCSKEKEQEQTQESEAYQTETCELAISAFRSLSGEETLSALCWDPLQEALPFPPPFPSLARLPSCDQYVVHQRTCSQSARQALVVALSSSFPEPLPLCAAAK